MMPTLSSLATPEVAVTTTSGIDSDDKVHCSSLLCLVLLLITMDGIFHGTGAIMQMALYQKWAYIYNISLKVVSSIPAWSTTISRCLCGLHALPCVRASKLNQQICISPESGRSSNLTHTGVEINTCSFQTGYQLPSTISVPPFELCFLAQSWWRETNVQDNWWMTMLPQFEGSEFDPRLVHDDFPVPLWAICVFPGQSIRTKPRYL